VTRDRTSTFAPQLVPKGVCRLPGFAQTVLSLCASGLSTQELQAHLAECYQVDVSPDLISAVTDEILPELQACQQRPLEPVYVAVAFDALRVKICGEGLVQHQAVYLALGVTAAGTKEVLGLWIAQSEGEAFWQRVLTEFKGRGVDDVLIALVDGLTGLPAAIEAVFPETAIHWCVVHLVRQSLSPVSWQERTAAARALRAVYQAPSEAAALGALDAFEAGPLGGALPGDWRDVAAALSPRGAALPLPAGSTTAALLDERHRESASERAQGAEGARPLSHRRGGGQADRPRPAERDAQARDAAGVAHPAAALAPALRHARPGQL
jgi:putative transposase